MSLLPFEEVFAGQIPEASESLSVALLLSGIGSVTPAGAVTVEVFDSVPLAAAEMVQLAV